MFVLGPGFLGSVVGTIDEQLEAGWTTVARLTGYLVELTTDPGDGGS